MTDEQIRALGFYERSSAFDAKERAVILFADRMTRSAAVMRDPALQDVLKHFSEAELVELALVVCMANFTNRFNDGLQVEPDLG